MKTKHLIPVGSDPRIPREPLSNEKHVTVVTDWSSFTSIQRVFTRILEMHYDEFLSNPDKIRADILVLRSSKLFPQMLDKLTSAISTFKENNPESKVVAVLIDGNLAPVFKKMGVDRVENGVTDEYELLRNMAS